MRELPARKAILLPKYDYSQPGAYFVTICTRDRQNLFWSAVPIEPVGAAISRPQNGTDLPCRLTRFGELAEKAIGNISTRYETVTVDKYVIMPNHIHLLVSVSEKNCGRLIAAPTLSTIVG